MDAVAEARQSVETALESWAKDGKTLFQTAKTLGVDTGTATTMLSGTLPSAATPGPRPGRRAGGRNTTGRRRTGGALTEEQLLAHLGDGSYNQSELATHFGVNRQTVARKLEALGGKVKMVEIRGQKSWTTAERAKLAGVGSG
jgi:uncharacterized protein YidB (DUF937 family)